MSEEDLLGTIKATYVLDGNPTLGVAIKIIESLRAEISEKDSLITELRSEVERLTRERDEQKRVVATAEKFLRNQGVWDD